MDCKNNRAYKNILGTCWAIAIQMMICFGDSTKDELESVLNHINIDNIDNFIKQLIELKRDELERFFPLDYIKIENREELLFNILKAFITRYLAKLGKSLIEKPSKINDEINNDRCERVMNLNFKKLFSYYSNLKMYGGDLIEQFYFANILSIFFLQNKIFFKNYTRKNYRDMIFDSIQDIGIIIKIESHICCCFICEGVYKFYNDHDRIIYDCDWINLLSTLEPNEDLFLVKFEVTKKLVKLDRKEYFNNLEKYDNYKRVQYISVISKKALEGNINNQIYNFLSNNFTDKINDFILLHEIGIKFYNKKNYSKTLIYLLESAEQEFYQSQNFIGEMYDNGVNGIIDIDKHKAKEYFEIAFNNGSIEASNNFGKIYQKDNQDLAIKYFVFYIDNIYKENKERCYVALKLGYIYEKNGKYQNAVKYFEIAKEKIKGLVVTRQLYYIYYNNLKIYRKAIENISNKSEYESKNEELKDFNKLKELADKGFVDLQLEVGKKYLKEDNIEEGIRYIESAIEQNYEEAIDFITLYYIDKDKDKALFYQKKRKE